MTDLTMAQAVLIVGVGFLLLIAAAFAFILLMARNAQRRQDQLDREFEERRDRRASNNRFKP